MTPSDSAFPPRRAIIYATSRLRGRVDGYVPLALEAVRPHAGLLIVVASGDVEEEDRARLGLIADVVMWHERDFTPDVYLNALTQHVPDAAEFDEIVLTGDSWFGPTADFAPVLDRMADRRLDFWEMVENRDGPPRAFPEQGFPSRLEPWTWVVASGRLIQSSAWVAYWKSRRATGTELSQESEFSAHFRAAGFTGGFAFGADDFANSNPALLTPDLLIEAGCPLVKALPFGLYPPYLHQQAVIGRDVIDSIESSGYPVEHLWQHLARTVQPRALNTNAGMLEVIPGTPLDTAPPRIVAVAHVTDVDHASDLFDRLASLPAGYDLVVTTSDGRKAVALSRLLDRMGGAGAASIDVRVTPAKRGRDMGDFFIACRDVLVPGRYDIVVKVHARTMRRKTLNVRRYFRRYQLENLLASKAHVAGILELFRRESGLGMIFPPMIHIGYATMGRAWGDYRASAEKLFAQLGISVPLDKVSPLAPFGGMWFARPEALRLLTNERWLYRDYGKPGRQRYRDLARLQERSVAYAAAELGYHSRTVLTPEHASIAHTAIEFKADQLFSTSYGYPVDAILLIQRAGNTGYGGIVGLSRMYLRLNHRMLAKLLLPFLAAAQWAYGSVRALTGDERFIRPRDTWRDEEL